MDRQRQVNDMLRRLGVKPEPRKPGLAELLVQLVVGLLIPVSSALAARLVWGWHLEWVAPTPTLIQFVALSSVLGVMRFGVKDIKADRVVDAVTEKDSGWPAIIALHVAPWVMVAFVWAYGLVLP